MEIGQFIEGRGYRVFVRNSELVSFRHFVANTSSKDRELYSLNSGEEETTGGAFYFLGLGRTQEDMRRFVKDWTLRVDSIG